MAHGLECNCMVCNIGKKLGMIKAQEAQTCANCGGTTGEGGTCKCG